MAIGGSETGRPAGRARRDPAAQRRTGRAAFLPREEGRQAGEESRADGCGSRPGFGQIRPLRGRARLARCREDGWSLTPEPGGPIAAVVGIMPPMPAQPLSHEGFAEAPPLHRRLDLAAFDDFQPGRGTPTGSAPEPSGEPEFAHRNGERYHRQGRSLDRPDAPAGFAGNAQHHRLTPGRLDRDQTRRSRRPKRSVHPRTRA